MSEPTQQHMMNALLLERIRLEEQVASLTDERNWLRARIPEIPGSNERESLKEGLRERGTKIREWMEEVDRLKGELAAARADALREVEQIVRGVLAESREPREMPLHPIEQEVQEQMRHERTGFEVAIDMVIEAIRNARSAQERAP